MRQFLQIAAGIDPLPLLLDLHRSPQLWDRHTARTNGHGPHGAVSDIWCRFRALEELTTPESFAEPFTPVAYPAWTALPHLRPLVMLLMARVEAVQLGGVLITRVPPGCQVEPHDDQGRWHPEWFTTKLYVVLATNDRCVSTCEDETLTMRVGDCFTFDNLRVHSTVNNGDTDRITLIVSLRVE